MEAQFTFADALKNLCEQYGGAAALAEKTVIPRTCLDDYLKEKKSPVTGWNSSTN